MGNHVGHKLGGNRFSTRCFAISAGIAVVRQHGCNLPRRGPPTGIYHHQQFHEVIVNGTAGGLNQINISTANRFLNLNVEFAIGKALKHMRPEIHTQVAGDLRSQGHVGRA